MSAPLVLVLALTGGIGAVCRVLVDQWVSGHQRARPGGAWGPTRRSRPGSRPRSGPVVPMGTLVVNASACAALGVLTSALAPHAPSAAAVVGTGFLGGYSTFSTACVEGARLVRAGCAVTGIAHAARTAVLCLAAVSLGLALGDAIAGV